MNRRSFLSTGLVSTAALATGVRVLAQSGSSTSTATPPPTAEPRRPEALDPQMVKTFVNAGHRDLPKIREMLAAEPRLINASVDLGGGDWESALGAAAHVGNRPIALHLLASGTRPDVFCAAMLGESDFVTSLIRFSPASANARGPHGYLLMYHIGYSGKLDMAEAVGPHVGPAHLNQALLSAAPSGHTEFVAWLLAHGVTNVNLKSFGKTPLDLAIEKGHEETAKLLRAHGGIVGGDLRAPSV